MRQTDGGVLVVVHVAALDLEVALGPILEYLAHFLQVSSQLDRLLVGVDRHEVALGGGRGEGEREGWGRERERIGSGGGERERGDEEERWRG